MWRNYLKVGIRNILKNKVYSFINGAGLAMGIAASMLIILYIADELSYDRFLKDSDRIYRVGSAGSFEGSVFNSAVSSGPIASTIHEEIPEVEEVTRFGWWRAQPMRYGDRTFVENKLMVADSNFFQFFSFPLLSGNRAEVLRGTNHIVLTESTAHRYFGSENPIGKILLRGEDKVATEVTGVVKDPPANSHIQFEMILSSPSWPTMQIDAWSNTFLYTYLKTRAPEAVKKKLDAITERNLGPELERIMGVSIEQFKSSGNRFGFFVQPIHDIHLKSHLSSEITPPGNIQYVYVFGAVAIFILMIACINFMNLSTARATTRAKEVGVRKSIGALREKLIAQFLSESMIFSFASTFIALSIVGVVLNSFNSFAGKEIGISTLMHPIVLFGVVLFAAFIGLLAGTYPAFYLTQFKPIDVFLKGHPGTGVGNRGLRNSLVTFQFIISIVLIVGSLVINKQLSYMRGMSLGFDKENVIDISNGWSVGENTEPFKTEIALHSEFKGVSFASALPPRIVDSNLFRKGGNDQDIDLHVLTVDYDHLSTMGHEMTQGRFFSREFPSDSSAIILNETAYRQLGFKQIEGSTIINFNASQPIEFNLIGVMKDFNFEDLRNSVKPMAIILNSGKNYWMVRQSNNDIAVRISGNPLKSIETLERIWKKYSTLPFEFTFLDENIDAMFRAETRMGRIVLAFTVLAIAIACLGLFGLATYLGEQRSKEISIRKIMGASIPQVIKLLLKDFALLVAVAFVIGAPVGWYIMRNWLDGFAYRTTIDWWMIGFSGFCAFATALFTISYQSIKVARENPVNNLKSE